MSICFSFAKFYSETKMIFSYGIKLRIDESIPGSESTTVIMYTPITIIPSRTYLSMASFAMPPPISTIPVRKNPKEFKTWATRYPVVSVLKVIARTPIHMKRRPSRIAAMMIFFENTMWNI